MGIEFLYHKLSEANLTCTSTHLSGDEISVNCLGTQYVVDYLICDNIYQVHNHISRTNMYFEDTDGVVNFFIEKIEADRLYTNQQIERLLVSSLKMRCAKYSDTYGYYAGVSGLVPHKKNTLLKGLFGRNTYIGLQVHYNREDLVYYITTGDHGKKHTLLGSTDRYSEICSATREQLARVASFVI